MKAIFLDFNGVLDSKREWDKVDPTNLKNLKIILEETDAKLIISSSIKNTFYVTGYHNRVMNYLIDVLQENNISIYGITPYLSKREDEIKSYLREHPEFDNYCIIDDDFYFDSMKDHMVKLKSQMEGGDGLKKKDALLAIKILKKKNELLF